MKGKNEFPALTWYYTAKNAPILYELSYETLRVINYKINGKIITADDYNNLATLSTKIDHEANYIITNLAEVIRDELKNYCDLKDISKKIKRKNANWYFDTYIYSRKIKKPSVYKQNAMVSIFLGFDVKCKPSLILLLWIKGLDKNRDLHEMFYKNELEKRQQETKIIIENAKDEWIIGTIPLFKNNKMKTINKLKKELEKLISDYLTYNKTRSFISKITEIMSEKK